MTYEMARTLLILLVFVILALFNITNIMRHRRDKKDKEAAGRREGFRVARDLKGDKSE